MPALAAMSGVCTAGGTAWGLAPAVTAVTLTAACGRQQRQAGKKGQDPGEGRGQVSDLTQLGDPTAVTELLSSPTSLLHR